MNDASTPTTPADPNPSPDNRRRRRREDAAAADQSEGELPRTEDDNDGARSGTRAQRPSLSQKAKEGLAQKLRFLNHLVYTLDTLVHAELCVLYYMEYARTPSIMCF